MSRRVMNCILLFVGVFAAVSLRADDAALPIEVLAIRENAERLRSGEFTATGTITLATRKVADFRTEKPQFSREDFEEFRSNRASDPGAEEPRRDESRIEAAAPGDDALQRYEERIECAFDIDFRRLAFRRSRNQIEGDRSRFGRTRLAWFVGSPEETIIVRGAEHPQVEVSIQAPVRHPSEVKSFIGPILDPRSMGWGSLDALGFEYGSDGTRFLDVPPASIDVFDEGNGIHRLERVHTNDDNPDLPSIVQSWWCDEAQGRQPVRYTTQG